MAEDAIADLFRSGRIAELAVLFLLIEIVVLWFVARRTSAGLIRSAVFNALSGLGLMLALRAALRGDGWGPVALFMTLGLLAHLADLAIRMRARQGR